MISECEEMMIKTKLRENKVSVSTAHTYIHTYMTVEIPYPYYYLSLSSVQVCVIRVFRSIVFCIHYKQ